MSIKTGVAWRGLCWQLLASLCWPLLDLDASVSTDRDGRDWKPPMRYEEPTIGLLMITNPRMSTDIHGSQIRNECPLQCKQSLLSMLIGHSDMVSQ